MRNIASPVYGTQQATVGNTSSSRRDLALGAATERLAEIESLGPDWDPYGSEAPSAIAVNLARTLLQYAVAGELGKRLGEALLPLHIAPIADGGVQLEWSTSIADLEVYVSPAGTFSMLIINRQDQTRRSDERDNLTLIEVLAELDRAFETPVRA